MVSLKISDLRKTFFTPTKLSHPKSRSINKKALAGISIELNSGLYGLLGPNGAGKSTLIHIITGSLAPDSGEVLWCGKPAMGIGFRRILGYMPQQQGLYDSYTGRRFLAYMAALKEISRKAVAAEVDRVAAAVNLTAELDKRLSAYSGGMKQRLLLASALLGDPKLLILDEPTAGLDPKERVRLRELLADMAKDRIILVATHVVSDVETVATKVILLRAGKIVDAAPVPELMETSRSALNPPQITAMYKSHASHVCISLHYTSPAGEWKHNNCFLVSKKCVLRKTSAAAVIFPEKGDCYFPDALV